MDGVQHKWIVCSTNGWCTAQMDGVQHKKMVCSTNRGCAAILARKLKFSFGQHLQSVQHFSKDGVQRKWMVCSTNGWCAANIKARSPHPQSVQFYIRIPYNRHEGKNLKGEVNTARWG